MKRALPILVALLLPTLAFAQSSDHPDWEVERVEVLQPVPEASTVQIDNPFGDVRCRFGGYASEVEMVAMVQHFATEGPRVKVVDHLDDGVLRFEVLIEHPDGTIQRQPIKGERKRADLACFVPTAVGLLEVETGAGTIQLRGVRAPARLRSASGKIQVLAGSAHIDAESGSGEVAASFNEIAPQPGQRLVSSNGPVTLRLPLKSQTTLELLAKEGHFSSDFSIDIERDDQGRRGTIVLGEGEPGHFDLRGLDISVFRMPTGD